MITRWPIVLCRDAAERTAFIRQVYDLGYTDGGATADRLIGIYARLDGGDQLYAYAANLQWGTCVGAVRARDLLGFQRDGFLLMNSVRQAVGLLRARRGELPVVRAARAAEQEMEAAEIEREARLAGERAVRAAEARAAEAEAIHRIERGQA